MVRILAAFLFLAVTLGATDCEAQGRRGLLMRPFRVQPSQSHQGSVQDQVWRQSDQFHRQVWQQQNQSQSRPLSSYRNPTVSRILDGPTHPQRRNPAEVNSRYIGGFHQSHFNNIGIPSGDIGIRGNAYNWRTW